MAVFLMKGGGREVTKEIPTTANRVVFFIYPWSMAIVKIIRCNICI
jgi:hypothetical protein